MRLTTCVALTVAAVTMAALQTAAAGFTVELVSRSASGTGTGNGASGPSVVSADGRFVVFTSVATNLIAGFTDTNGSTDVFVRDLVTGTTTLVSVNTAGTATGNGASSSPVVSADGRFVAFTSLATNLVSGFADINGSFDVFVRDLATGTTTLVSVNAAGVGTGNGLSTSPVLSPDGRIVAFVSASSNLTGDSNNNGAGTDVYVRDLADGATTLVSRNAAGTGTGNLPSTSPVLSAGGGSVAFVSESSDLTFDVNNNGAGTDVYVRDLADGATTLVSRNAAGTGTGNAASSGPVISADGRLVAFTTFATNLVAGFTDTNGSTDVLVRDLVTGTTTLVSFNGVGAATGNGASSSPAVSADGRFVAFTSLATNLVSGFADTNGSFDVFVRGPRDRHDDARQRQHRGRRHRQRVVHQPRGEP